MQLVRDAVTEVEQSDTSILCNNLGCRDIHHRPATLHELEELGVADDLERSIVACNPEHTQGARTAVSPSNLFVSFGAEAHGVSSHVSGRF